jgi:hypothetical protein
MQLILITCHWNSLMQQLMPFISQTASLNNLLPDNQIKAVLFLSTYHRFTPLVFAAMLSAEMRKVLKHYT